MKTVRTVAVIPFALLALAACGGSEDPASAGSGIEVRQGDDAASTPAAAPSAAAEPSAAAAPSTAAAPATGSARPAAGSCTTLPEAADGRYTVADAGTVVVTREGDRLVLGAVTPAAGWTPVETDTEQDEVEVELQRGADELDLEAEIENGVLRVETCADDD